MVVIYFLMFKELINVAWMEDDLNLVPYFLFLWDSYTIEELSSCLKPGHIFAHFWCNPLIFYT